MLVSGPQFLKQYNKPVAQEICAVYVDTMQKCMYSLLKHYIKKLTALKVSDVREASTPKKQPIRDTSKCLQVILTNGMFLQIEEAADKDDLIGAPEGTKRLFFSSKLAQKQHVFTLGERAKVLKELEDAVVIPHVAEKRHERFHIEVWGSVRPASNTMSVYT
jgi:hypothetical protein